MKPIVIKIGGAAAENDAVLRELFAEIAELDAPAILVHGGGKVVSEYSRRLGYEPLFRDGIRYTTVPEMEIVDMGLAGAVNTRLVRIAVASGLRACGITGADDSLIRGVRIAGPDDRTGKPAAVNTRIVSDLLAAGIFPVVAPVSSDPNGEPLNINADAAAQAIATALGATALIFVSDIPGVLREDVTIKAIQVATIEELISAGVVSGGMTAKLRSCGEAISDGIDSVIIGSFAQRGDIQRLLTRERGTTVHG